MWWDKFMIGLLRSPLHGMFSGNMMLVTVTGRKSGKQFTTPVNFLRLEDDSGEYLLTTSLRGRTWWRNLRGGAPVTLRLKGKEVAARAEAFEEDAQVTALLKTYFQQAPQMAKYFNVSLDASGKPEPTQLATTVKERVVIRTTV